jgi:hypothetical protein|tara:strand:+ start:180 stop:329 length:150 start_codon:yes stop_codon:yes gene_type:complete
MSFVGPFGGIPGFYSGKTRFVRNNKFKQIALLSLILFPELPMFLWYLYS